MCNSSEQKVDCEESAKQWENHQSHGILKYKSFQKTFFKINSLNLNEKTSNLQVHVRSQQIFLATMLFFQRNQFFC